MLSRYGRVALRAAGAESRSSGPMKRRGNRRYYQHHEVLLVRRIRSLLYEEGFTTIGARNWLAGEPAHRLDEASPHEMGHAHARPIA